MAAYTFPHHPVYSIGSPAGRLSTYTAIAKGLASIIRSIKQR